MRKEIYMGHGLYKYVQETLIHTLGKTINASHPIQHEEVERKIVKLDGGGFIRKPFPVKKATIKGADEPEKEWHFFKGEKWEWKI